MRCARSSSASRSDAVVLELDQERLDGVVAALHAETDRPEPASDRPNPSAEPDRDRDVRPGRVLSWPSFPYALAARPRGYGAIPLGAVAAGRGAPLVVLGDAKARSCSRTHPRATLRRTRGARGCSASVALLRAPLARARPRRARATSARRRRRRSRRHRALLGTSSPRTPEN